MSRIPDTLADLRCADNPSAGEPFVRFYTGAPLVYMGDVRLRAQCQLDVRPLTFSLGNRAELALLADQVVTEVASTRFSL